MFQPQQVKTGKPLSSFFKPQTTTMSSKDNLQRFNKRRTSLRLYKNIEQDINDDKFYQNKLSTINIVHGEDASEFQNLNAQSLGQAVSNQFQYHQQEQSLIIIDSLPNYASYAQKPPPDSKWEQSAQIWDQKIRSNDEYLKLKRNVNLTASCSSWRDLNYSEHFMKNNQCAVLEDVDFQKLNAIGEHLLSNPADLNHKVVTSSYHHLFNYLSSNSSKISATKLVCREPNVITKSTYNSIVDFHHLTKNYGAGQEYFKFIQEIQQEQRNKNQPPIQTDKVFNCQTSLLSPGCVNNLTTAPMSLGTIHIVRNGAGLLFAMDELDENELSQFYQMFGHTADCPISALQQQNMFPDIGAIQKFAAKHEIKIWCGLQAPGSMAIIQENCMWWSIPLTTKEIWMETVYFGRKLRFTLEYNKLSLKSAREYLKDNNNKYTRCKYGCKNRKWLGDPICSAVIKAGKFNRFDSFIRQLIMRAQHKARAMRRQRKKEKNERLGKLSTKSKCSVSFTKVYICIITCIFNLFCFVSVFTATQITNTHFFLCFLPTE